MKRSHFPQRQALRGVALIEALIGILIFAFGVLGLVGLQATMTQAQTAGKFRADAANLVSDLFGLIQTDHLSNMNLYAESASSTACSSYARCAEWKAKVVKLLPSAQVNVTVNVAEGKVAAEVSWQHGRAPRNLYRSTMSWQQ